jgi:hypothetical protein
MKIGLACIIAAFPLFSEAQSTEKKPATDYNDAKPLKGDYQIYGGTLGEMRPPTAKDEKVAFMFTGPLAKHLFNQIGPDVKKDDSCSSASDYRERRRGDLHCTFTKDEGFSCYFGLDVVTGKGTYGSIC